jgi:hypothetical protein
MSGLEITTQFTRDFNIGELPDDYISRERKPPHSGRTFAQFFTADVQDLAATAAKGRPVVRQVEMVRVYIPGDRNNVVERRVKEADKIQYAKEYAAFKKVEEFVPEGTRLEHWPILNRAQVIDLKYLNIWTVEDLANLSDDRIMAIGPGGRQLVKHAKAFLETAAKGAVPAQLVAENEQLQNKVVLLQNQLTEMMRKMETMARKLHMDTSALPDPLLDVRVAAEAQSGAVVKVDIPPDYRSLSFQKLRQIVVQFSAHPPQNKEEAIEQIEEYKANLTALRAA